MPVLDMLVLDMLDSAMLESLPPMLECAPTIWELRSLARHYFLPEFTKVPGIA